MLAKPNEIGQNGFSLIELVVAMTVMGIVLGAAFSLMANGLKVSTTTYEMTDAQENLRIAQEYITRDLRDAGAGLKNVGSGSIFVPKDFQTGYVTRNPVPAASPSAQSDAYPPFGILTSENDIPGNAIPGASPAANYKTKSDRITMLSDSGFVPVSLLPGKITQSGSNTNLMITSTDVGQFSKGDLISVLGGASGDTLAFGVISSILNPNSATPTLVLTNEAVYGINQTGATGDVSTPTTYVSTPMYTVAGINGAGISTLAANILRVQIIQYFINDSGYLIRRVWGQKVATDTSPPFTDSVIADHVVKIQFRYFTSLQEANGNVKKPEVSITNTDQQVALSEVETTITVETVHQTLVAGARQQLSSTSLAAVRNVQFKNAHRY